MIALRLKENIEDMEMFYAEDAAHKERIAEEMRNQRLKDATMLDNLKGMKKRSLMDFCGCISDEDAEAMMSAIDDCRRI